MTTTTEFKFSTDSETGTITAETFDAACHKLDDMLTEVALENGARGWVEDGDGERYAIGASR